MIPILLISFFLFLALGFPVAIALGLSSVLGLILQPGIPLVIIVQRMFVAVDSFPLMAVPLYMLAGFLMSSGGVSKRIINFSNSLVGHITGGLAHVNILTSMIFAGISACGGFIPTVTIITTMIFVPASRTSFTVLNCVRFSSYSIGCI